MDNNAQSILVLAIAKHGKRLATSDSYCQVYLTGYMADYPNEKKTLTSLRNLGLPKKIISYLNNEITETELNALVSKLKLDASFNEADLSWGVDAWADALLVPEIVRQHIRRICFPLTSLSLNSEQPVPIAQQKRKRTLLPLVSLILFTFMTSQLADGYNSKDEVRLTTLQPSPKAPATTQALVQPDAVLTSQAQTSVQVGITPHKTIKKTQKKLEQTNRPTKSQRSKRLRANIEAFLKTKSRTTKQ